MGAEIASYKGRLSTRNCLGYQPVNEREADDAGEADGFEKSVFHQGSAHEIPADEDTNERVPRMPREGDGHRKWAVGRAVHRLDDDALLEPAVERAGEKNRPNVADFENAHDAEKDIRHDRVSEPCDNDTADSHPLAFRRRPKHQLTIVDDDITRGQADEHTFKKVVHSYNHSFIQSSPEWVCRDH